MTPTESGWSSILPPCSRQSKCCRGILTPKDYATIDTIMAEKYGISSCSLYRGIDLIYGEFRGNMSHYKEVTQCQEE